MFETERHNGIGELLEILGSIINGFALPLKKEHVVFLERALIPLHRPKCVALYHQQLSYCITQVRFSRNCTPHTSHLASCCGPCASLLAVRGEGCSDGCASDFGAHQVLAMVLLVETRCARASFNTHRCTSHLRCACAVLFLNELEEILELIGPEQVERIYLPLFRALAKCVGSSHFQVAERALFLWNNDHLLNVRPHMPHSQLLCSLWRDYSTAA